MCADVVAEQEVEPIAFVEERRGVVLIDEVALDGVQAGFIVVYVEQRDTGGDGQRDARRPVLDVLIEQQAVVGLGHVAPIMGIRQPRDQFPWAGAVFDVALNLVAVGVFQEVFSVHHSGRGDIPLAFLVAVTHVHLQSADECRRPRQHHAVLVGVAGGVDEVFHVRELRPVGGEGGRDGQRQQPLIVDAAAGLVLRGAALPDGAGVEVVVDGGVVAEKGADAVVAVHDKLRPHDGGGTDVVGNGIGVVVDAGCRLAEEQPVLIAEGGVDSGVEVVPTLEGIVVVDIRGGDDVFVQNHGDPCQADAQHVVMVLQMAAKQMLVQLVLFLYLGLGAVVARVVEALHPCDGAVLRRLAGQGGVALHVGVKHGQVPAVGERQRGGGSAQVAVLRECAAGAEALGVSAYAGAQRGAGGVSRPQRQPLSELCVVLADHQFADSEGAMCPPLPLGVPLAVRQADILHHEAVAVEIEPLRLPFAEEGLPGVFVARELQLDEVFVFEAVPPHDAEVVARIDAVAVAAGLLDGPAASRHQVMPSVFEYPAQRGRPRILGRRGVYNRA